MSNDHPAAAAPEESGAVAADPADDRESGAAQLLAADQASAATDAPAGATGPEGGSAEAEAAAAVAPEAAIAAADAAAADDPDQHRFECRSCGFVYDPAEGIRKLDIPAGTPFSALDPVGFRCPVCRSRVGAFRDIGPRDKPSGFEENLNLSLIHI